MCVNNLPRVALDSRGQDSNSRPIDRKSSVLLLEYFNGKLVTATAVVVQVFDYWLDSQVFNFVNLANLQKLTACKNFTFYSMSYL